MQELETIMKDIRGLEKILIPDTMQLMVDMDEVEKIIRNHMNDGWISVEDERLWDILFEEACVEGEQKKRIYDRLKEISSEPYRPERSEEW